MIWLGLPSLKAHASIQTASPPHNSTPSPTLTHTNMPSHTQAITPTPSPPADIDFVSYYYHPLDIPAQVAGPNDFWVEVDLSAQMLFTYRGNQILKSFSVSTGTTSYQTVTGTYKIYAKYPSYTMIGPGYNLPDVPYSMFFYKGYSIHGTYWHSNFGSPMSHGCVNMDTDDAAWVYQQSTIGSYVFIHY